MSVPDLSPGALFDLEDLPFGELFEGLEHAWQALGARLREHLSRHGDWRLEGRVEAGAFLVGDEIALGAGSRVEAGAYVRGPCWIGRDVQVRHGAYLRGDVIVGDGCVVGHATETKGSVFLPGAKAGHFAYVGDSILGRDTNLGAGTKLANLRLLGDEVSVVGPGFRVPTGLRKLGAILGDGARTGCNAVTNPGTVLGPGALVHPGAVASGWHPPRSLVRR